MIIATEQELEDFFNYQIEDHSEVVVEIESEKIDSVIRKACEDIAKWKASAPCFGHDQDKEHTELKEDERNNVYIQNYCSGCNFVKKCLRLSLLTEDQFLVWGSKTPQDRKMILKYIYIKYGKDFFSNWSPDNNMILDNVIEIFTRSAEKAEMTQD